MRNWKFCLVPLVAVMLAGLAAAASPVSETTPSLSPGGTMAICTYACYCPKPLPCTCFPCDGICAPYCCKPLPCTCFPCDGICAPYCCKPAPCLCNPLARPCDCVMPACIGAGR